MFERFTDRARRVVVLAQERARQMDHPYIDPGHLLLALVDEGEGIAVRSLGGLLSLETLQLRLLSALQPIPKVTVPPHHIPFTPASKKVLELSLREALQLGHNYIGTEHILLSLMRYDGYATDVVKHLGVELPDLRKEVIRLIMQEVPKPEPPTEKIQEITTVLAEAMEQIATANKQLMLAAHTISGLADRLK